MNAETLRRAKALLENETPLKTDCGALCGAACCRTDADGKGGVYLFPSEDAAEMVWGEVRPDGFAPMLMCTYFCDRTARPFACRIFPLTPVKGEKGWTVRMDARARGLCPLYRHGARGLNPDFARAAVRAVRLIASDPEGEEFLNRWAALEKEYRLPF